MDDKRLITSAILPMRIISEANNSDHWAAKYRRHKLEQKRIKLAWFHLRPKIKLPCEVHLTRFALQEMDDNNMVYSCKYIRDQIADCIIPGLAKGRADGNKDIKWFYHQQKAKEYALQIDIYA